MGVSTIYIGSDHRGFELKNEVRDFLRSEGYRVEDVGAHEYDRRDDYLDYAAKACSKVLLNNAKAVLFCGAGQGMTIAANKHRGIRAAPCWDVDSARRAKEHVDANVICISAEFTEQGAAREIVSTWLESRFLRKKRYVRRVRALNQM
jgi:RpiB/LacA/LacB family sugar-phosphate isomerase